MMHTLIHIHSDSQEDWERTCLQPGWSLGSVKAENMIHSPEIIMRRTTEALHNEKQSKKHLNCEQIAINAKNSYSDKVIIEMIDIIMTIRQAVLMFMLEKACNVYDWNLSEQSCSFFWASISTKTYWPLIWIWTKMI